MLSVAPIDDDNDKLFKLKLTDRSIRSSIMNSYASRSQSIKRQPLEDTTQWVNNQSSTPPMPPYSLRTCEPSPPGLPHHESLQPGGVLQMHKRPGSPLPSVVDKRLSAVSGEGNRNTNRDSQISTTSTTASGQSRPRKTHIGPWHLGKTIGKGSSGRVRKARHVLTGQEAAIKIVSKRAAEKSRTVSLANMDTIIASAHRGKHAIPFGIEREVVIMKLIEHPNVISLYDVWENRGEMYLVLEYIEGGELFEHISQHGCLPEHEAVRIFRQLIAGLSCCHRFNICHRDLKPENILIDRNNNIKIVDFGMAALQPADKWLQTSCGSPHYASPEVIRAERYRGDRADIWSCGVILYAMIAGCLPFDTEGDWDSVIQTVVRGEYVFPPGMSGHARDLISRILQMDPKKRIPIKLMWEHPLLKKYEYLDSRDTNGQRYIGPLSPLTSIDCGAQITDPADIDIELLRNLQNLWHGVTEQQLAQRLLNDEPNYEKVLYTKLLRFREEQLENFQGPTIEYSTSDYHHKPKYEKPPPMPRGSSTRASLLKPNTLPGRTQSKYSILVEVPRSISQQRPPSSGQHRRSSVAETEGSYDPFRSSRSRFNKAQADHARITVLRNLSNRKDKAKNISISSLNHRMPSNATQQTKLGSIPDNDVFSIVSLPPAASKSQLARLRDERRISRGSTRHTFSSNTGSRVVRKSVSYRRGVSFQHSRKRSISADMAGLSLRESSLALDIVNRRQQQRASSNPQPPNDASSLSATSVVQSPIVQRKRYLPLTAHEGSPSKARITSQYWKEDTRKVSKELENFCDEAFNRSSVASSVPTTIATTGTDRRSYGTPATSRSLHDNLNVPGIRRMNKSSDLLKAYEDRPLPRPPPDEQMGNFTQRELAKTRAILKRRAAESTLSPGYLDEVIAHLDRLMLPSAIRQQEENRRAVSTPDPKSPGLASNKDTFERFLERRDAVYRSRSEPSSKSPRKRGDTVRLVSDDRDQNPISPVKPLTIRKKSGSSTSTDRNLKRSSRETLPEPIDSKHSQHRISDGRSAGLNLLDKSLEPIVEHEDDRDIHEQMPRTVTKKKSWFFRGALGNRGQHNDKAPPPLPPKDIIEPTFENLGGRKENLIRKRSSDPTSEISRTSSNKEGTTGKMRFLKLFGKRSVKRKKSSRELDNEYDLDDGVSFCTASTESHQPYLMSGALNNKSGVSISQHAQYPSKKAPKLMPPPIIRSVQPQHQNWLMKFLRIKPAVAVLPFQVSKVRARKEIVTILKDWRRYGIRDIVVDRAAGRVWARVAEKNALNIRPVSLAVELFTVLERGRKANLALAKFTQEKGAKSSFERVAKTMQQVLENKGFIIEDEHRAKAIKSVLVI